MDFESHVVDNKKLLLRHHLSPGDVLVMTATIESLMRQYPNQYEVRVDTTCMDIWNNNPHMGNCSPQECRVIQMHYPAVNRSHMVATGHFMSSFCEYLGEQLNLPLKLQVNKPYIYLNEEESNQRILGNIDYIVINSGVKNDYTCKGWGHNNYQKVVDLLKKKKINVVQIGQAHHSHKPLDGAINLLGKTNTRELFSVCHNSLGGIGSVTFLQHIMAALDKPYVCIAGGREPFSWIWYPRQAILSTQGQLVCCSPNACWKSRVVRLNDGEGHDNSLCHMPTNKDGETIPKCMEMFSPEEVVRALERYIEGKIIKQLV